MKLSLNWLKNIVDLSGISVDEIVDKLTMAGLEVEDVVDQNLIYENFIVGFVKDKIKHPNADKLSVCTVTDGSNEYQVVCGAPNVEAGQKIILAVSGAVVPQSKFKIGKTKIRGIESNGMICSDAELNFSDDHLGIKVLSPDFEVGKTISEAFGLNDVILEIAVTPNRPDALSHIGVARDLAAIFIREVAVPEFSMHESDLSIDNYASIEVIDSHNCPRYSAKVVLDIEVKESPDWLKNKIKAVGLRPINNIVDVTNLILFEFGQPLHAFDLDKLSSNKIIVKQAGENKKFTTLDSKERILHSDALMICDGERAVAIAGVMGGENSEVSVATKNILIESAYFNSTSVRKTSKLLGLSTDASYRFERGTDPNNTLYAAEKAAYLIMEVAGGKIAKGHIDVYPTPINNISVLLRYSRVDKILGYKIEKNNINRILSSLGFVLTEQKDDSIIVEVPTFRPDIEREIDLIEEIARIDGYDNIPTVPRVSIAIQARVDDSSFTDEVRNTATGLGFFEILTNSLQSEKTAAITGLPIKMLNPQSSDMAFLRTSLIPGALMTVSKNINVGEKNIQVFEVGKVFNKINDEISSFEDFVEEERVIFLLSGHVLTKEWYSEERKFDYFDLKGFVNSFFKKISLDYLLNDSYTQVANNIYEYIFQKKYNDNAIGCGGKVNKDVLKYFDIQQEVFCFELSIDSLKKIPAKEKKFSELLKYPKMYKDFAFVVDNSVSLEDMLKFINRRNSKLLKNVSLFDKYVDESLGADKKSLAFSLEYFDSEKTLTDEEVDKDFFGLIAEIKKEFNATLRG